MSDFLNYILLISPEIERLCKRLDLIFEDPYNQEHSCKYDAILDYNSFENNFEFVSANSIKSGVSIYKHLYLLKKEISIVLIDAQNLTLNEINSAILGFKNINSDIYFMILSRLKVPLKIKKSMVKNRIYFLKNDASDENIYETIYMLNESYYSNQKLKKLNLELESKIKKEIEKSRQKDSLIIKNSSLNAMKNIIFYLSHHWRQPLNGISLLSQNNEGIAQDILDLKSKIDVDKLTIELEMIVKNSHIIEGCVVELSRQITLFRDIFTSSKISNFKIKELLNTLLFLYVPLESGISINIEIDCDEEHSIVSSKSDIVMILIHLLNNSSFIFVKRAISNPKVTIKVSKMSEYHKIEYRDNGGGIDKEKLEKLFVTYFPNSEKKSGASLFVIKEILKKNLNGDIEAKNSLSGAFFEISLRDFDAKETN